MHFAISWFGAKIIIESGMTELTTGETHDNVYIFYTNSFKFDDAFYGNGYDSNYLSHLQKEL